MIVSIEDDDCKGEAVWTKELKSFKLQIQESSGLHGKLDEVFRVSARVEIAIEVESDDCKCVV